MKRTGWLWKTALVALCAGATAWGQIGVYGTFSASKLNVANTKWVEGATFGLYDDKLHLPLVNFGFDVRGTVLGGVGDKPQGDNGQPQVFGGMIGPRAVAHLPIVPLRPYLEGLVGVGHVQAGQGVAYSTGAHLGYGVAAGLDLTFFPRLDWRVVDFQYGGFHGVYGATTSQKTFSTGWCSDCPSRNGTHL